MESYIYLRALKHADYTVFCVQEGQKNYWDPQFNVRVPFSSGQQVKRSILSCITESLGVMPAPTTFVGEYKNENGKNILHDKEPHSACDPLYIDQLLGGWMKAAAGGKERTLKRRSPLSISAMRALHPLLSGISKENLSFDRTEFAANNRVIIKDADGNLLDEDEIAKLLEGTDRSIFRRWIPDNPRATGMFVYDVAIDLRTLFAVSLNKFEPEISDETAQELIDNGWIKSKNVFGECLIMPKEERDKVIPALAKALLNWRITSNQARTFSLMETLAVAISDNANTLPAAIRAKLIDEGDKPKAKPIVDENAGADVFVTLPCAGYVVTECESVDALQKAEEKLIGMLQGFDYENQI